EAANGWLTGPEALANVIVPHAHPPVGLAELVRASRSDPRSGYRPKHEWAVAGAGIVVGANATIAMVMLGPRPGRTRRALPHTGVARGACPF
ncbi:MAG: hypothetical protein ACKVVP_18460, partial [Chloroflexota bacterium]